MVSTAKKKQSIRKASPRAVIDTRQRIIQRSIALFNRYGVQNVAIDHIASELKISPGNLTYHFKRKDDLIQATLEVLRENLRVVLQRPVAVDSPKDGAEYLIRLFRTLWAYRFFFNSLANLLQDDRRLRNEFAQFRSWTVGILETNIGLMLERGFFRPAVPPNSFRLLAELLWGHFLNWLRLQQIETPAAPTPSNQALYDATLHLWSLCQLWLTPQFSDELLRMFQALLVPELLKPEAAAKSPARKRKAV